MKSRMLLNKLFGPKAAALLENTPGPSTQSESSQSSQNVNPPSTKEGVEFDPLDPIDKRKCREVHYPEFQYATNANGEERQRLFVFEPNSRTHMQKQRLFVFEPNSRTHMREYAKYVRDRWYCLGCRSQPFRKSNQGRIEGNKFYAPLEHYCKPVSYAEALVKQQKIKMKISENRNLIGNGNNYGGAAFGGSSQKSNNDTQRSSLNSSASMTTMTNGFREVHENGFFYGYNADGTANMRLIVYEPNDKGLLREYGYTTSKWYCLGCSRITKTRNFAGFENGILKCPVAHLCQPYTKKEVDDRQQLFERRKGAQKRGPKGPTKSPAAKRAAVFNSGRQSDDDHVEILSCSHVSSHDEIPGYSPRNISATHNSRNSSHDNNTSDADEAILNNSNINQKFEIPEHQHPETPSVISLPSLNLDGYKSPPLSEQLLQLTFSFPSPITSTFSFNNPSKLWLKTACETLQIPYNHEAYQLWATIDIDEIRLTSKPENIKEVTAGEDSGFRAISLLLTGREDAKIKVAVNKWFYKNFNKLGKCLGVDFTHFTHNDTFVFETFFASDMSPVHCEALFHILGCRVGVYNNDKLMKYGNWESDDGKVTLLLERKNNCYNVVTSLLNN
uniref:Uncharacterized protein n=1 Tax=Panagrolaimus sp. ES5 TaxID=591445 RepID=A0AC34FDR3_9BILA